VTNFWTKLNKPFLALAPMYDVTDFVFREIVSDIAKPDVLFTEFVNTDALFSKGRDKVIRDLYLSKKQHPIVAQIWGINPDTFYKAAELVKEMGFDGIDINMGCPERTVVKNGAGSALIKNLDLAKKLIEAVKEGAKGLPISVKTRIGYNKIVTQDWISFLLEQKLDAITIHGRIATQKSEGNANWEEIGKAVLLRDKISPNTLIIGNGDAQSYKEALEKHKKYKVDGVMIGRGIFANPWVFEKNINATKHSTQDSINLLLKHTKMYVDKWSNDKNFDVMKKFFKIYVRDFKGSSELRQKLMACKNYNEVEDTITRSKIL
jgi:nifR3 family TIM-barrel protein